MLQAFRTFTDSSISCNICEQMTLSAFSLHTDTSGNWLSCERLTPGTVAGTQLSVPAGQQGAIKN